jgi:positive regulator of sigma E activity
MEQKYQKVILIPAIAAILWLLGVIIGYVISDMIFESDATTAVTIFWAIIWCIALSFSAYIFYKSQNMA